MQNFNVVKESLRELGIKQGFDLYEKATTEKLNSEDPFDLQWFSNYSSNWDNDLNKDLNSFFNICKHINMLLRVKILNLLAVHSVKL